MNRFVIAAIFLAAVVFSEAKAQDGRLSAGVQFASNWYRNGIAARCDYAFSSRWRLSVDGTYYLTAKNSMDVYEGTTKLRSVNDGRLWDCNADLNIVFGKRSFRFYLITGVGFAYGYRTNGIFDALFRTNVIRDENGEYVGIGMTEQQIADRIYKMMSLNGGCGVEWQISPKFRWHLEQFFSLGLPFLSTYLCRTGVVYCF